MRAGDKHIHWTVQKTLALLAMACGCGGGGRLGRSALSEMEVIRETPGAREGAVRAPGMSNHALELSNLAYTSEKNGDPAGAALLAERATAAYHRSLAQARLVRATEELRLGSDQTRRNEDEAASLKAKREIVEKEISDLEKRLGLAREASLPAVRPNPKREAARQSAARSLAMEARLLCSSAGLLDPDLEGLAAARDELARLDSQLQGAPNPVQLDASSRLRTRCLALLTKARQTEDDDSDVSTSRTDVLFAELSSGAKWDPSRDERGIRIVLHDAFQRGGLTAETQTKLEELGRLALTHPSFPIQVVVHNAAPPNAAELAANGLRAQAAVDALVRGGASRDDIQAELAKALAPMIDPADALNRRRNARLEIVFISPDF